MKKYSNYINVYWRELQEYACIKLLFMYYTCTTQQIEINLQKREININRLIAHIKQIMTLFFPLSTQNVQHRSLFYALKYIKGARTLPQLDEKHKQDFYPLK